MESILVTGGAGFIGSHTCLLLLKKGYSIFVLDSFCNSSEKSLKQISFILKGIKIDIKERLHIVKGDLRNKDDIEQVFQLCLKLNKKIEAVIHFAGLKSVFNSLANPFAYWENNVVGTINLLKIMDKEDCHKLIFSSSATVYKAQSNKLIKENDLCEPINPYGNTKLAIEKILKDVYKSNPSKWRITCLRYFNPVGAHESGLIGEDPLGMPNNLYPKITRVAHEFLDEIKIFGSDWPTPDGTCVRDYIHVMDVAEGHLLALSYISQEKTEFLTVNLGTGMGTSVLELIRVFEKINKVKVRFSFTNRREGDIASLVADNSLAKTIFKWSPKRNIEDICRDGWNWQLKNPNGY